MTRKLRYTTQVQGWIFPSKPGLVWHSGKWWVNGIETRQVYNNGSLSVLYAGSKCSIKKLRKEAQPCNITIHDDCPF